MVHQKSPIEVIQLEQIEYETLGGTVEHCLIVKCGGIIEQQALPSS